MLESIRDIKVSIPQIGDFRIIYEIKDDEPEFAVIPYREYQVLVSLAEEQADAADVLAFRETQEETYPGYVIDALLNGDNPIRLFRSYRGLTQKQLAKRIGKWLLNDLFWLET